MTSTATEPIFRSAARGIALFLGAFALLNAVGGWITGPGFDANVWWVDVRQVPGAQVGLALAVAALLAYAVAPARLTSVRVPMLIVLTLLIAATAWNVVTFYSLLGRGALTTAVPVPLSIGVFASLLVIATDVVRCHKAGARARRGVIALTALTCAIAFPLAQMVCFGKTDYRRPADVIVVFGARAYADGSASDALADRVRTAVRLYHDGLAPTLLFSGGPGDGAVHETEVMRRLAVSLRVPAEAIVLDRDGVNTRATVENTPRLLGTGQAGRILAVSHFYHLPRIKLAYQRAAREVYTVPADARPLTKMPVLMAREVAALWVYYFNPLVT